MFEQKQDDAKAHAAGFARYAYEYIEAARLIDDTIGRRAGHEFISPTPAYFLAMHGVELTLKAFLRYHGVTSRSLRNPREHGHDLQACFRKAKELGLLDIYKMRDGDEKAMALLSALNVDQGLRYIRTGWKEFPSWAIVEPLAVRLHQAVAPLVGYKTFNVHFG
ncbi:hypothetical protein R70006_04937 [Paraburkholderia domus]|jgi:hypothetical protein|uniref:hypothetical protein n=1 Tax=Paraburkholderia domus TaxID=2793075 RepID=UPI001914B2C0|nr:hypothetical protein [Paraburkholderia domus]MBK5051825.1 hypothetical protein [Burkholderia sp. R-70006]CAE6793041.1 hypothetical protein R70006_04937 [Paraburkholderia domus]